MKYFALFILSFITLGSAAYADAFEARQHPVTDNAMSEYSFDIIKSATIPHDIAVITVRIDVEAATYDHASEALNARIRSLRDQLQTKAFTVATSDLTIQATSHGNQRWTGAARAYLRTETPELIAPMQTQLKSKSFDVIKVDFETSDDKWKQARDALEKKAITEFRNKAHRVSESLGYQAYRVMKMSGSYNPFPLDDKSPETDQGMFGYDTVTFILHCTLGFTRADVASN